jgi:hypothetical protein
LRNLQLWRSLYEADEVGTVITGPDQREYCLHDIEYIYACRLVQRHDRYGRLSYVLSDRQRQAIELFLYDGVSERDCSLMMGIAETNPIGLYATEGLKKIVTMIQEGELPRFQPEMAA